jgi:hypothetical protein
MKLVLNRCFLGDQQGVRSDPVARSLLSEENFLGLEAMGDDLASLLNMAVEQFISGLRENSGRIRETHHRFILHTWAVLSRKGFMARLSLIVVPGNLQPASRFGL